MRNRDTSAAVRANILRKWRRWAEELRENGWRVEEPAENLQETESLPESHG